MPEDRSALLPGELKVDPSEIRWHFIADFYDAPISGLAFFRNRLYRFCCFREDIPEHYIYVLHELTPEEQAQELGKAKFEEFVGTHWSFDADGKPLPRKLRSEDSQRQFYDTEKRLTHDARERPIVAWFDTSHLYEPTTQQWMEVDEQLSKGLVLNASRIYREATGFGIARAKQVIGTRFRKNYPELWANYKNVADDESDT
jgi:hypothetical protein